MPRIANLGDLDWDLNPLGDLGHFYTCEHLCLRMIFDHELEQTKSRRKFELINYIGGFQSNKGDNTKFNNTPENVYEEDSQLTPSAARELGRFLAKETYTFAVSVLSQPGSRIVRYILNHVGEIKHPTSFISGLTRKTKQWVNESGLNRAWIPVIDEDVLQYGIDICEFSNANFEAIERLSLSTRKMGYRVEWCSRAFKEMSTDRILRFYKGHRDFDGKVGRVTFKGLSNTRSLAGHSLLIQEMSSTYL